MKVCIQVYRYVKGDGQICMYRYIGIHRCRCIEGQRVKGLCIEGQRVRGLGLGLQVYRCMYRYPLEMLGFRVRVRGLGLEGQGQDQRLGFSQGQGQRCQGQGRRPQASGGAYGGNVLATIRGALTDLRVTHIGVSLQALIYTYRRSGVYTMQHSVLYIE